MHISNTNHLNILDLPDEILFIIVKNLNIGHVVYSLIDIDERFAQMVFDPLYIRNLDMTVVTMKSYFDYSFSIDDQVLSRICEKILPQIHDHVNKLTIEQYSMERIFFTFNYPQLYSLSLVNFQEKILFQYLKDHSILRDFLSQQITHLDIDIQNETTSHLSESPSSIFGLILHISKRLIHLNFCQLFPNRKTSVCIYEQPYRRCRSLSLTQLKINVETFADCLSLLEELDYLSKLIINVKDFSSKHVGSYLNMKSELPTLKYFSLTLNDYEDQYDDYIIPLLRRMINLEELILYLIIIRVDSTYVDGIQLHDDILIYMPRLNKFTFSINTGILGEDTKIHFSSDEYTRSSFIGRGYGQVSSYVYSDPMRNIGNSHIYSLPYQFKRFFDLNNCFHFQDGIFDKVERLIMIDRERPFEHQFFKLTSHHFPLVKELTIYNMEPQKDKQHSSTLIRFPNLILLNLLPAYVDYAEQFLLAKNTHLPCLLDLYITYESLTMLTNNFTNDATSLNCTQLRKLTINEAFARPKTFHTYFPLN